jgi:hypothetical protein
MIHSINQPKHLINSTINTINVELKKDVNEGLNIKKSGNYVKRPIKATLAEYYYDNNEALANVVNIKQEDIIKTNYIHIEDDDEDTSDPNTVDFFEQVLNENKEDLALLIGDHTLYGAGAGEIIAVDWNTVKINHIPQKRLEIILVKLDGIEYPIVQVRDYKFSIVAYNRLLHFYYPDNFPYQIKSIDTGYMFWYGGGMFNDFYDKPFYLQLVQEINSQIVIRELDTQTFNTGNQLSGIVYINKSGVQSVAANPLFDDIDPNLETPETIPTEPTDPNNPHHKIDPNLPDNVETLKKEINKAGLGNAFFYEETDDPMQVNYINLTNNNQQYIINKLDSYKAEVYRRARIPIERLMDSGIKEAMNSHKTVAIWTIYLNSLNSQQQNFESLLSDYIFFIYQKELEVSIDVPEFEEFKIARAQLAMDLFNNAGLTHEAYVKRLNSIYEWVDVDNLSEWYCKDYFFNGKLLSDLTDGGGTGANNVPSDLGEDDIP